MKKLPPPPKRPDYTKEQVDMQLESFRELAESAIAMIIAEKITDDKPTAPTSAPPS